MTPTRRTAFGVGFTGAAALLGTAFSRAEAHVGTLANEYVKKLALEPRGWADFGKLAEHFRMLKTEADKEAALYETVAKTYRSRGIPGTTDGQARDAARALEHVAEHARDTSEALEHLVETYAAMEENFSG